MKDLHVVKLTEKYFKNIVNLKSEFTSEITFDELTKILNDDSHQIFILLNGDQFIGYIECMTVVPESEIYSIIICDEFRNQGYATYLLNWYVNYLKEKGCSTIFLEVNTINIGAINLYKKFGFVAYGERKKYYGENDAILLKFDII